MTGEITLKSLLRCRLERRPTEYGRDAAGRPTGAFVMEQVCIEHPRLTGQRFRAGWHAPVGSAWFVDGRPVANLMEAALRLSGGEAPGTPEDLHV